jgi:hypothetical protein
MITWRYGIVEVEKEGILALIVEVRILTVHVKAIWDFVRSTLR